MAAEADKLLANPRVQERLARIRSMGHRDVEAELMRMIDKSDSFDFEIIEMPTTAKERRKVDTEFIKRLVVELTRTPGCVISVHAWGLHPARAVLRKVKTVLKRESWTRFIEDDTGDAFKLRLFSNHVNKLLVETYQVKYIDLPREATKIYIIK